VQALLRDRSDHIIFAAIAVLAVAVRAAAAAVIPDQSHLLIDIIDYRESAMALVNHGYMINRYQMPLYSLMIAVTGPGIGQLVADILLSALLSWVVGLLTLEIFEDRLAAFFAAAAIACYPPLIFMAVVGLSESLFIALVFLAFLCWYRGAFTPAAVFAVLAILTRPIFDVFAPLLVVMFALVVHRLSFGQTMRRLFVYVAIYCALMTPWWVSNFHAYGHFVRLTAGAGTALYAGNNPLNRTGGGNLGEDYDLKDFVHLRDPVERDRALREAAVNFIVENPGRFLELAWLKFTRIWRPWPVNAGYSSLGVILMTAGSFLPVLVLGAVGIVLRRRMLRRLSPIFLFAAG
jgi:4-amino-4-deoxy-L-arabinose transferase-like glycosyltransferase